jgi:hypothetical protein
VQGASPAGTSRIPPFPACYNPTMTLFDELRSIVRALDGAGVEYALAGGLAVAVWGAPRATKDIDLLIQPDTLPRAMAAARECGFTLEALPFEFKDGTSLQRVNKVDAQGNLVTVDFILVDRNLAPAWAGRARLPFAGSDIVVVGREALIAMKALAARPQDIADIQNLKDGDR